MKLVTISILMILQQPGMESTKGLDVATGAFVYFTEMICDTGETFSLKGTVMVVK